MKLREVIEICNVKHVTIKESRSRGNLFYDITYEKVSDKQAADYFGDLTVSHISYLAEDAVTIYVTKEDGTGGF